MGTDELRIGIVGGGPAGLVAACAARAAGFDCTVFEQAQGFRRVGGGIGIQSNGLRVLEALGLLERFRPRIEITHQAVVESPPGRVIARADFREVDVPHHGFAVALRSDLQEVLLEAAVAAGASVQLGRRCSGASGGPDGVRIELADGTFECDLLLACDGIRSAVRAGLGARVRRRVTGEAYLRLVAPCAHPDRSRIGEIWAADGRRLGAFPLPGQRTYVFCSVPAGQWQHILRDRLDGWVRSWRDLGPLAATLMESICDWEGAVYDELTDLRVSRWHAGRRFLVGDAAHAMTPNLGQGANCAMVDALVLVNLLAEQAQGARDWEAAGARYERLRKPFVTRIQNAALHGGRAAGWRLAPARALRDTFFRLGMHVGPLRRSSLRLTAGFNAAEQPYLRAPERSA